MKKELHFDLNNHTDFTIADFLNLSAADGTVCLVQSSVQSTWVKRIIVVESADLAQWADAGDLILTTGYSFYSSPEKLFPQIRLLKEKNVAGLCIRNTPRNPKLAPSVLDEAERLYFPILQLPVTAVFANIVQEGMELILNRRVRLFQDIHETTERLLSAMWKANTPEIGLQVFEEAFHNPVLIFDDENDLILTKDTQELLDGNLQEQLIRQIYNQQPETLLHVKDEDSERDIPIHFFSTEVTEGTVMILLEYYSNLSDREWIILHQIGHSLLLEMKNALVIKKIRRKYKSQFIEDLLTGKLGNDPLKIALSGDSEGYHLSYDEQYRIAVINLALTEGNRFVHKEISIIRQIILNLDPHILFTIDQGKLILILQDNRAPHRLREDLNILSQKLNYVMNKDVMSFCISDPHPLQEMNAAYHQALHISKIVEHDKGNTYGQIITMKDLNATYLLSMLPESESIQYCKRYLGPLMEHDRHNNSVLYETLMVYLQSDCNKQQTAANLQLHYNTVVYRLAKIEEILQVSLNEGETQFHLRLAYRLAKLFM